MKMFISFTEIIINLPPLDGKLLLLNFYVPHVELLVMVVVVVLCVCVCVRARVHTCVRACVRACVCQE